jgi:hypothetical protein
MVTSYSVRKDGNKQLSENFKVREFASRDGADMVLIDSELVLRLQAIRNHFGRPVIINSAYRTEAHNRRVGGASNSQHLHGRAADIVAQGVDPQNVAKYAETIGINGIGLYTRDRFVHIDTRTSRSFWRNDGNGERAVNTHGGAANPYPIPNANLRNGSRGDTVKWLQFELNKHGHRLAVDGIFGALTDRAVRAFQTSRRLVVDGIVGPITRRALGV